MASVVQKSYSWSEAASTPHPAYRAALLPQTHLRSWEDGRGRMCVNPTPGRKLPWAFVTLQGWPAAPHQRHPVHPWGPCVPAASWQAGRVTRPPALRGQCTHLGQDRCSRGASPPGDRARGLRSLCCGSCRTPGPSRSAGGGGPRLWDPEPCLFSRNIPVPHPHGRPSSQVPGGREGPASSRTVEDTAWALAEQRPRAGLSSLNLRYESESTQWTLDPLTAARVPPSTSGTLTCQPDPLSAFNSLPDCRLPWPPAHFLSPGSDSSVSGEPSPIGPQHPAARLPEPNPLIMSRAAPGTPASSFDD